MIRSRWLCRTWCSRAKRGVATYAVGDIQGCFRSLKRLLHLVGFDRSRDRLWCVGDLVNRGPGNLATLRFVRDLGERATCVLGNHDLHLLAIVFGGHEHRASDTMEDVLEAPDCMELAHWLRGLPLLMREGDVTMVHAGIPHVWDLDTASALAGEVEGAIRGADYVGFFERMYGDIPDVWDDRLVGMERLRATTNYLTRMRFVDSAGRMDFDFKGVPEEVPPGGDFAPWFRHPTQVPGRLVFGHWAALGGDTAGGNFVGLDTGCVWGRTLTAYRLEDGERFCVECSSAP